MDDELSVSSDDDGESFIDHSDNSGGSSQKPVVTPRGFGAYCVCGQRLWVYRCGNVRRMTRHLKSCEKVESAKVLPFTKIQ